MTPSIYLDNSASTPLAPEVISAIHEALKTSPGNASSVHQFGKRAKTIINKGKQNIAHLLGVDPKEIVFTSGGTESMNMLIFGSAYALLEQHAQISIIYSPLDHPSTLQPLQVLANKHQVHLVALPTSKQGAPTPDELAKALQETKGPSLVVLSAVNSETGCMIDLEGVAKLALHHNTPLIIDGVALLGKVPFTIPEGVSAMGFSAHKIHGPTGIGFVYKKRSHSCHPFIVGGAQMGNLRAGSENLIGIAGLSAAIELLDGQGSAISQKLINNTLFFKNALKKHHIDFEENGEASKAPGILNLYFPTMDAETLLIYLDQQGIAISAGTACSSGALEPSLALKSMNYNRMRVIHSVRFSFSRFTTHEELAQTASTLAKALVS